MPKHPTKPTPPFVPVGGDSSESGRYRARPTGYASHVEVTQLAQRVEDHIDNDNQQLEFLRSGVDEARAEIREVRGEVRDVSGHVGNLRVEMAEVSSQVSSIVTKLDEQMLIKHVKMTADVDIGKATEIAKIDDKNDSRKARRAILVKVCVVVISWIAGMIIEHFR